MVRYLYDLETGIVVTAVQILSGWENRKVTIKRWEC